MRVILMAVVVALMRVTLAVVLMRVLLVGV